MDGQLNVILKTIAAFPRGRTTNELFALLDVEFMGSRREAIRAELNSLQKEGLVILGADNKWRAASRISSTTGSQKHPTSSDIWGGAEHLLVAAAARFTTSLDPNNTDSEDGEAKRSLDANRLLRYYRAALQSDPRGALTQSDDRHGTAFQLLSGSGDCFPDEDQTGLIEIELDNLPDSFREAVMRRDANDTSLAVGWPIAVARNKGAPAIRPVGLIAGSWEHVGDTLRVRIETDDVMVNPDWVKAATRFSSWSAPQLLEALTGQGGTGLPRDAFLSRLREAAAKGIRGRLTGRNFAASIDPQDEGIFDALGLFLPTSSSFTAGAVRDLDQIGSWDRDKIARTALGSILGLSYDGEIRPVPPINVGPLNHEQIRAVSNAVSKPLSVVTGPPGTGKSQAIVAMAATVMLNDGSVVVASKNHQALDAVEERLSEIAPKVPFSVRTLDPTKDIDQGLISVIAQLVNEPSGGGGALDLGALSQLAQFAERRLKALDLVELQRELNVELAEIHEMSALGRISSDENEEIEIARKKGLIARLIAWILGQKIALASVASTTGDAKTPEAQVARLRIELDQIGEIDDPVELTGEIEKQARLILKQVLADRTALSEDQRINLSNEYDDLTLHEGAAMSRSIAEAVISHRPLWLASVLGTPKRIPLYEGLFDLVIFDEASQCDIASALPLLARAKRAVIVGDDRQLAFISQIGIKQDRNLMAASGLPERGTGRYAQGRKSLFDLARSTPDVPATMLRDQYRSAEDIVGYINSSFYGGKLRVSADLKRLKTKTPAGGKPGLAWTDVRGPAAANSDGSNVNRAEIVAIADEVHKLLITQGYQGSIGVIAPFRTQVLALEKELWMRIPEDLRQKAELRVGTVDGFQGQERDIILFSPTVNAKIKTTAVTFLQRDWRRLNVAISRARAVAHVFGDLKYARSGQIKHLQTLAACATEPPRGSGGEGVFDSEWERIVFHKLRERGLDPQPQYDIAGRRLDFALFGKNGVQLDLEVDGRHWHQDADGNRKLDDHWRDHQLRSLGWKVRRFWVDELKQDMERCLDLVERDLS